jgi:hypothetical protein
MAVYPAFLRTGSPFFDSETTYPDGTASRAPSLTVLAKKYKVCSRPFFKTVAFE